MGLKPSVYGLNVFDSQDVAASQQLRLYLSVLKDFEGWISTDRDGFRRECRIGLHEGVLFAALARGGVLTGAVSIVFA